jgi:hypothetical protein
MNELVDGPHELAASEKVTAIGDEQWHEINEAQEVSRDQIGPCLDHGKRFRSGSGTAQPRASF